MSDKVWDNILRLGGMSKYIIWQGRMEGAMQAFLKQIVPPVRMIDSSIKDVYNAIDGKDKKLEIVQSIPIVGKIYYWRFGRGLEKLKRRRGSSGSKRTRRSSSRSKKRR